MAIEITNSSAYGYKTFVRAPSDVDLRIDNCFAVNGDKFLDIFEPKNYQLLGLPAGVLKDDLLEILASLKAKPNQSQEELEQTIKASPLAKWLSSGSQVAKFASEVLGVIKAGYELVI